MTRLDALIIKIKAVSAALSHDASGSERKVTVAFEPSETEREGPWVAKLCGHYSAIKEARGRTDERAASALLRSVSNIAVKTVQVAENDLQDAKRRLEQVEAIMLVVPAEEETER